MPLEFAKPEHVSLKGHPEFSERWLQERIIDDPTILALGDVELVTAEKIQPKAGRLDLLLHDEQLNRRYEVELMLGATDPSHIMRCIEYWDIERRRYPAYDHVAVLVAEDITSRFLNLMSLLAGSIPLIAIQFVALRIDHKIGLHFVRVLDQTTLRSDDTFEGGGGPRGATADRAYWQQQVPVAMLELVDRVVEIARQLTGAALSLDYRKNNINLVSPEGGNGTVWFHPQKTQIRIGGYVPDPEAWVKRFDEAGQVAALRRGNKAVSAAFKQNDVEEQGKVLRGFFRKRWVLSSSPGLAGSAIDMRKSVEHRNCDTPSPNRGRLEVPS